MKKEIKAWAAWNTKQNCPCVNLDTKYNITGSAIFTNEDGTGKKEAIEWLNQNFPNKKERRLLSVRLKYITILV